MDETSGEILMADSIQTDPEQAHSMQDTQDTLDTEGGLDTQDTEDTQPVQPVQPVPSTKPAQHTVQAPVRAGEYQPLFQEDDDDFTSYTPPPRRGRRILATALIVVLLLALVGGGTLFYIRRNNNAKVTYTQSAVTSGNLSVTVSASGPLKPNAEYDMNFSASGQIKTINVKVGQTVKAGQVLATLNSTSLQDALAQAQQNVNNAQVVYNDAVNNGASQSQLDQDNNSLQSAQVALKTAQDNLNATTLTAPANATVASINGVVGQNASGGSGSSSSSSSSSAFIVLLDLSSYTISSQVNEADIANVQVGQPVRFNVNAYPNSTFRATVSSIGLVGTSTSSVVTYPVTLSVDMNSLNGAHLYPGMTATANITTAQRIGATLVSNAAFSFTTTAIQAGVISASSLRSALSSSLTGSSLSSAGNQRVVLELKNGQLTPVLVTVGLTNGTFTEVLSGLQPNDQVVVGATGGPFANLSSGSTGAGLGGGLLRNLGGGNGGTRNGAGNGRTTTGG
jgi:HlyD family secretion protein